MNEELVGTRVAPGSSRPAALLAHVRMPLYRDGYALVLNSGMTALLGVGYWLIAARDYTPHVVGVNTAAISAMMFLAGVAQLNLMSALVRFVPVLRSRRRRFIAACYGIAGAGAVVCAAVFLAGIGAWAPDLRPFAGSTGMVVWFVAATLAWCVFNLQDSALTGLGAAVLVPAENAVYGVAKIVLLVVFASLSPRYGVFGSWTAGLVVSLLAVNALVFGPLVRRRARRDGVAPGAEGIPGGREIARFVAPDYLGALVWLAATTLMPVIVISVKGPAANAFFSMAWMIAAPLIAISSSTGAALVANAAAEPARLAEYARRVLRQTARMVVPAALAIALAAPYVLRLFGHQYARHAALTLTLLALSAIPSSVTSLYVSVNRVRRRMRFVVLQLAALCVSVLVLGTVLLSAIGIAGVGVAWLVCQTGVALALLMLDPGVLAGPLSALDVRPARGAIRLLGSLRARRSARADARLLARVRPWGETLGRVELTVNQIAVGRATGGPERAPVYVKLARTEAAAGALRRCTEALRLVGEAPELRGWPVATPRIIARGELDGMPYVVESALDGATASAMLARGAEPATVIAAADAAIEALHRLSGVPVTVDELLADRWLRGPARAVEAALRGHRERRRALGLLVQELSGALVGRTVTAARIHGDYVPGNVLLDSDGRSVTGIIDWELSEQPALPAIDTGMFRLAAQMQLARRELGPVVADLAVGRSTAAFAAPVDDLLDQRSLVLLCWLHHVGGVLGKSDRYARHPIWRRANLHLVLDTLASRG